MKDILSITVPATGETIVNYQASATTEKYLAKKEKKDKQKAQLANLIDSIVTEQQKIQEEPEEEMMEDQPCEPDTRTNNTTSSKHNVLGGKPIALDI